MATRERVPGDGELSAITTALVGIAGTLGVLARYGVSRLTLHSDALVWSTVGINIAGSFLLGLLVAEHWFDRDVREALGVGFLGGFTTFSTFSVQIVLEVEPASRAGPSGTSSPRWWAASRRRRQATRWVGSWHSRVCERRHTRPPAPA